MSECNNVYFIVSVDGNKTDHSLSAKQERVSDEY